MLFNLLVYRFRCLLHFWGFHSMDYSLRITNNQLKLRIEQLEKELEEHKVMAGAFSHDKEFVIDQNKALARRFKAYKASVQSLGVEIRSKHYGSIAWAKHEARTKHL